MASINGIMTLWLLLGACCVTTAEQYTSIYDNIDLQQVISNRRLLLPFVMCMLEKGRCSVEGKVLRTHVADALKNGCARCTDKQRNGARIIINHLIVHEKDLWRQLSEKYNTQTSFVKQYEDEVAIKE